MGWKLLKRSTVYDTEYAKLYSDNVVLPNGHQIEDYSIISFPNGVVVVATDRNNKLIAVKEYKYAINKTILNLPSGTAEKGLTIEELAKKELLEETGYTSDEIKVVREIYEYPSKLTHSIFIVRMINAIKISEVSHDESEQISEVILLDSKTKIDEKFNTSYNIAAIALTLPEFIR